MPCCSSAGLVALALTLAQVTPSHVVVQPVEVTAKGRALSQGLPQELLAYTPQEGQWKDMLGMWVRKIRTHWPRPKLAREEWKWLYYHTCSDARKLVEEWEGRRNRLCPARVRRP